MLDLALYDRIDLSTRPWAQRWLAETFLRFDYRKLDLVVEGLDKLPKTPVILALNHTDDFSYWPFQYSLHKAFGRYAASWVKGKNFEGRALSAFMRVMNNIPIASRGYLLTRDFMTTVGRRPSADEYRLLRDALNAGTPVEGDLPRELLERPRDILGRPFEPAREHYIAAMDSLFSVMMARFVDLNRRALEIGADLLVYPQGSRSIRLSRGHGGIGQVALHLGATIVPVGVSGGDIIYPKRSPVCHPGRVVYRIGDPILPAELEHLRPAQPYQPFSREAEVHKDAFQAVADLVMERIDGLVDEPYRFGDDHGTDGVTGTARFL
ncbi:MAG: hypothetical protein GXP55_10135 [Deltaproteobacteria bacterium]|nr:hypothetical protein [Deltaproteobacteria bacterium]